MEKNNIPLVSVQGLYKKFCKNLKYNMWYGVKDLSSYSLGIYPDYSRLRKKEFWALNNVSFDIFEKEIIALVGVNGSGKTTLIRMLAGIYDIERGNVSYRKDIKRVISVFAIKSGLHPALSGRENIYLKGAYYGLSRQEVDQNMDFIVSFSGISNYLETPLGKYSSGMKTRLAMSIALSIEGEVLYIDEGFTFSDPGFRAKCITFLQEQYRRKGRAFVFATHRIRKISDLANRIILLDKGSIVLSTYDIEAGLDRYSAIYKQNNL